MKNYFVLTTFTLIGLMSAFTGCATGKSAAKLPALKDAYKNDFKIGVAVNGQQITGEDTNGVALIKEQFNATSPENVMKWALIHPYPANTPGTNAYNFELADAYVDFGGKNHMFIVGHTLVWHAQTPQWVFRDENGRPLSRTNAADRALLLQRMHDHIQTVVGRYKGRVQVWDVVNEALNDSHSMNDTNMLRRQSPWVRILGEEFIVKAFQYAHEADPDAILRYNDYNLENPAKLKRLKTLIQDLQAQGVPVMAIGSQTHATLTVPSVQQEDNFLTEVQSLGLPIHITELDVVSSQRGQQLENADVNENAQANAGADAMVAAANEKLAKQYADLFRIFLKHRDEIKLVTFWGVTDADSWRRQGAPLLFDGNWKPKPAFYEVIKAAQK